MDIVGKARELERRISRGVDKALSDLGRRDGPAPLEIIHAVVERAEQQIQESGRGRRVFPFNHVIVHLVAGARDKELRGRYGVVVEGPPTLAERLTSRLQSAGCTVDRLTAELAFSTKAGADWESAAFHVEFDRIEVAPARAPAGSAIPPITLTAAPKAARQRIHAFTGGRIDIGRGTEVLDQRQRLIRTNHVAFSDAGPDTNTTISRRHAHVSYDAAAGVYRVFDDHSLHGTSVIRNGRTIRVPPSARGTRLQTGDELAIGQARLRVTIGS
jgi:FHA domain-containing protein